jgi:hypothetical protein
MGERTSVLCSVPGCGGVATHKVAAPWTDGRFLELKTYGFACPWHVRDVCHHAETRWLDYEPVKGEKVGDIGIYRLEEGTPDSGLVRDTEQEGMYLV